MGGNVGRDRQAGRSPAGPGDRLVRAGVTLFAVGLAAVLATVVPFFFGAHDRPLVLNLLALLMPIGVGLALLGLLRDARRRPPKR